jgi:Zn finger protein HypA/HybF involved in hydrogenase expression
MGGALMMALLSSLCPPLGLFGSLVNAIVSEERGSGVSFLLDLATYPLPGNFATDFAIEVAKLGLVEHLRGNQIAQATNMVIPQHPAKAKCENCQGYSYRYAYKGDKILCSKCISRDLQTTIRGTDKLILVRDNVVAIQTEWISANDLSSDLLDGTWLNGGSLGSDWL